MSTMAEEIKRDEALPHHGCMEAAQPDTQAGAQRGLGRVLVVDDDRGIRETLRMLLEYEGFDVTEASDGQRALEILRGSSEHFVVLLDRMMPRLDGVGVLRAVVEDKMLATRHAYVLVTASVQAMPQALHGLLTSLRVPVLPKPLDIDELIETVEERMRRVAVELDG